MYKGILITAKPRRDLPATFDDPPGLQVDRKAQQNASGFAICIRHGQAGRSASASSHILPRAMLCAPGVRLSRYCQRSRSGKVMREYRQVIDFHDDQSDVTLGAMPLA
ncbi:MAG: hypothetical protein ACJAQU_002763 [Loktanella salsilacus]|jgi:hypothetical protein